MVVVIVTVLFYALMSCIYHSARVSPITHACAIAAAYDLVNTNTVFLSLLSGMVSIILAECYIVWITTTITSIIESSYCVSNGSNAILCPSFAIRGNFLGKSCNGPDHNTFNIMMLFKSQSPHVGDLPILVKWSPSTRDFCLSRCSHVHQPLL
jgi:hypothetical protein